MEVVYESPDARLKFEDMDEKSDDDDTQMAQERKRVRVRERQMDVKCILHRHILAV